MSRRRSSLRDMREGVSDRRARRKSRDSLTEPLPRSVLRSQVKAFLICLIVFAFAAVGLKVGMKNTGGESTTNETVTADATPTPTPGEDDPPAESTGLETNQ